MLGTDLFSRWQYGTGADGFAKAELRALVPHCDRTIVGLPHELSINHDTCKWLQGLSVGVVSTSVGEILSGVTYGHLMKVYDGTLLCPRDLLMLDCATMDSQSYYFRHGEVSIWEESVDFRFSWLDDVGVFFGL